MNFFGTLAVFSLAIQLVSGLCPNEGYKMTGFCHSFDENQKIVLKKAPCYQKCLDYGTTLTTSQKFGIAFAVIGCFIMVFLAFWFRKQLVAGIRAIFWFLKQIFCPPRPQNTVEFHV